MYKIVGADQTEYGPVDADQIKQWILEGRANGQTVARFEDGPWNPLSSFPEFAAELASAPAVPAPPSAAAQPHFAAPQGAAVPNYLVPSILVTVCCCLPFGIPAIVYAAQVNSKLAGGDLVGAQYSSEKAKMWCWISFGAGVLATILYAIMAATGAYTVPNLPQ